MSFESEFQTKIPTVRLLLEHLKADEPEWHAVRSPYKKLLDKYPVTELLYQIRMVLSDSECEQYFRYLYFVDRLKTATEVVEFEALYQKLDGIYGEERMFFAARVLEEISILPTLEGNNY